MLRSVSIVKICYSSYIGYLAIHIRVNIIENAPAQVLIQLHH